MSRLKAAALLGAAVILAVAAPATAADRYKGFERAEALITVQNEEHGHPLRANPAAGRV
jgi:hypothetical protein